MPSQITRIGVVGINESARRLLLPGLAASPHARVTAVISRDLGKARAEAVTLGPDVRPFARLEDALAAGVMDAVFVNAPVGAHVPLCAAALQARVAVICEKPLAPTAAEAQELADEAAQLDVRTVVNFVYRSVPGFRLTERWLAQHALGRPLHARFELLQGHNFVPSFRRASALLDSGSHLFDLMARLLALGGFGGIEQVFATSLSADEPDYGWSFTARTTAGTSAPALFTRSALGWRNGFRWTLSGDRAAIEVELDADRTVARTAVRDDGAPYGTWRPLCVPADLAADDERFPVYHLDRLVRAIQGEEEFPTFSHAVLASRVAEALARSAETGTWQQLNSAPLPPGRTPFTASRQSTAGMARPSLS